MISQHYINAFFMALAWFGPSVLCYLAHRK